jgi:P27 family predicted phage terminase small subunit
MIPPDFLTDAAKIVWNEIAPDLRAARLLTKVDAPMLHMACEAIATYRKAVKKCAEREVLDEIGNNQSIGYWEMIKSMSFKQAMGALQQFGMSPAARTRIAIQPQGDLFDSAAGEYFT